MAGPRRPLSGRIAALATGCVLLLTVIAGPAAASSHTEPLERAVKATYLYKFTPFVEWPPSAHASPASPFTLCVIGDAEVGDLLDRAVAGQKLGERGFSVRRIVRIERDSPCHLLYVGLRDPLPAAEALNAVRGQPVLTVTDAAREPQAKGIVNFVIRDGRVRFEIDTRAAAENGITVSSKLLSLAVAVRGRG